MKIKAAVAWAAGEPLKIEEVDLQDPQKGEVLVKIIATGVCHTDAFTLSGDDPEGIFPAILGHEGGGLSLIHISEPTRRYAISYAVFCLKKKNDVGAFGC